MLSGQQGPRAERHFNGCHDERVKLERGYPVSSIGERTGHGERRGGKSKDMRRVMATGEGTDGITGQVGEQEGYRAKLRGIDNQRSLY